MKETKLPKVVSKPTRPTKVIKFIECLICPTGQGQGKPFKLLPFEKKFIKAIYGPHINNLRLVRRGILSMARKNGKSSLMACLVLAHLCGPETVPNGEIYTGANEREQAALIFKIAAQIVRSTPELQTELKIVDSTHRIVHYKSGSFYRVLSSEAGSKHGLNPTFVIYDELAQSKNHDLYNALDTSMGAREEPLFIIISTQSADPEHLLSQLIDDGLNAHDPTIVAHLYETSEKADIWDEKVWGDSNPALNKYRFIADLRSLADKAKRMPSLETTFRNLYLNQRVDSQSPFIPRAEWVECQTDEELTELTQGKRIYLGLDLSATTDLCALVAISADSYDQVRSWFWKPLDLLDEHERRDRVPYRAWVHAGYIDATPGRSVDYSYIAGMIAELREEYEIIGIAYDRWRIENLLREFSLVGVDAWVDGKDTPLAGGLRLVPWGQGWRDMGPALDILETSILNRRFRHTGNPVLTWCFSNAIAIMNPSGDRKLDKSKSRFRIDGAVTTAMAIGLKARDGAYEEEGPSVYEERGIMVI